jgi:hypothetical protein
MSDTGTHSPPTILGYLNLAGERILDVLPGTRIVIVGNHFGPSGTVSFYELPATVLEWSNTVITVVVPAAPPFAQSGPLRVTTEEGQTNTGPRITIHPLTRVNSVALSFLKSEVRPEAPQVSGAFCAYFRLVNGGKVPALKFLVRLELRDWGINDTGILQLDPGEVVDLSWHFEPGSLPPGDYEMSAYADFTGRVPEAAKWDNQSTLQFTVGGDWMEFFDLNRSSDSER